MATASDAAHRRAQLARVARLFVFGLLSQPLVSALFASTLARYPAAALLVGLAEAAVRQAFPVKPIPSYAPPMPAPPGPSPIPPS
jgi:hypothetical protein